MSHRRVSSMVRLRLAVPAGLLLIFLAVQFAAWASPWDFNLKRVAFLNELPASLMAADGSHIYLAGYSLDRRNFRVTAVDVTNPESPVLQGSYEWPVPSDSWLESMAAHGSAVYVSTYAGGVEIIDVSDPAHLQRLGHLAVKISVCLGVRDQWLFVGVIPSDATSSECHVDIYDVTHPGMPQRASTIMGSVPNQFSVGPYLLVTFDGKIFDITDPRTPNELKTTMTGTLWSPNYGMLIDGPCLYTVGNVLAGDSWNINVFSLGAMTTDNCIAVYSTAGQPPYKASLAASRGVLFAGSQWGIQAFDLSQPIPPDFMRAAYYTPSAVTGLAVVGDYLYALDAANGLMVFRYEGGWPTLPVDAAQIVSYNGPTRLLAGQTATGTLRVKNTGTSTWSGKLGYKLAVSSDPNHVVNLKVERQHLADDAEIKPGESVDLAIPLKAPATAGPQTAQLTMIREFDHMFGQPFNLELTIHSGSSPARDWQLYQ